MAFTTDDFGKVWASTSPLTPYEFSESNYKEGWNFIGGTPPARQMWDFLQKKNDEKAQWLYNNKLSLSGGTLTGIVNGVTPAVGDNTTKLATTEYVQNEIASIGTIVAKSGENASIPAGSVTASISTVSLTAGTWVISAHINWSYVSVVANSRYGVGINDQASYQFSNDGSVCIHSARQDAVALQTNRIVNVISSATYHLLGFSDNASTILNYYITAVRIK